MAADQERADRIRLLKQDNPQLKWRHIADHVGVELRSAQMWQETGAISYDNAKKLAELVGRDVDWIMRGTDSDTPTPFAERDQAAELVDLREQLDRIETRLEEIYAARSQQTSNIIDRLDRLEKALNGRVDGLESTLALAAQRTGRELRSDTPSRPRAAVKRSPKPSRPA